MLSNSGKEGLEYPYTFTEGVSIPETFTGDYVLRAAIPHLVGVSQYHLKFHSHFSRNYRLTRMIGIWLGCIHHPQLQHHHLLDVVLNLAPQAFSRLDKELWSIGTNTDDG